MYVKSNILMLHDYFADNGIVPVFPSSALRIYSDNTVLVFEAIPTLKVMLTSYLIAVPTFVFLVQFRE